VSRTHRERVHEKGGRWVTPGAESELAEREYGRPVCVGKFKAVLDELPHVRA